MTNKDLEQIVEKAQAAFQKGKYQEAVEGFQSAVTGYQVQKKPLLAAEMANNLSVSLLKTGKAQLALEALGGTEEIFMQAEDRVKQAMSIGNRAAALEALKQFDEAEVAYLQSAELLKECGETELHTFVMQSLSALQIRKGKQLEGIISMRTGLKGVEKPSLRQRILKKLLELPFKFIGR
jgi:tetratricopeptide (TPR) repeat protein